MPTKAAHPLVRFSPAYTYLSFPQSQTHTTLLPTISCHKSMHIRCQNHYLLIFIYTSSTRKLLSYKTNIFHESSHYVYSFTSYNVLYGHQHIRVYRVMWIMGSFIGYTHLWNQSWKLYHVSEVYCLNQLFCHFSLYGWTSGRSRSP